MAKTYLDIQNSAYKVGNIMDWTNALTRLSGVPVDITEVYDSYDKAVEYAATNPVAYEGQVISVTENNKTTVYVITPTVFGTHTVGEGDDAVVYNNYLAEVGSKTEGDGNTIELDGQTLKLAGLTGLDDSKTYVPSYVGGKLIWAEPDTSTTDGQAAAIAALDTRATTLETVVNGKKAVGEEGSEGYVPAVKGLVDHVTDNAQAVIDEKSAREAADSALETKIAEALQAAKDYADTNDADTVYDDTQVKADIAKNTANIAALAGNVYTKTEIDNKVNTLNDAIEGVNSTIAGITHFATKIVTSVDEVTEVGILYLIKDETTEGVDKYKEYLFVDDTAVLIGDTTTDLSDYVKNDIFNATIAAYVTNSSFESTLKDYAKAADVNKTLEDYAKSADVVANSTFEDFKSANSEAITEACTNVIAEIEDKGYAVAATVEAALATKIAGATIAHTSDSLAEGVTVTGDTLNIVVDAYTKEETLAQIEEILDQINDNSESANSVNTKLENHIKAYTEKVGQIDAKDAAQDLAIEEAKTQAENGITNAINELLTSGQVATNKADIGAVKVRLDTLETAKGDHDARISGAEGEVNALKAAVAANSTEIGTIKGNITTLNSEDSRLEGLITALVNDKANIKDVYNKTDADAAIAAAINAIPATDLSAYAKSADVNAALAVKANSSDVYTKDQADATFMNQDEVDARINALIAASDPDGDGNVITNIQNLVEYVENNAGEIAKLVTDVATNKSAHEINTAAIAAINDTIAELIKPVASTEITIAKDGTLGIGEVNVNKLVQTEGDTLVLNGGSAV